MALFPLLLQQVSLGNFHIQGCPEWSNDVEENIKLISEENDQGQVQIDAFHPSCNYSKAQESNFQIMISFKEGIETQTTTPKPTNPTPKIQTKPTTPTPENKTHIPKPSEGAVTT